MRYTKRGMRVNNIKLYLVNHLTGLIPPTRLYPLKARLYRWAGIAIHPTAMIISSANIWGSMNLSIGKDVFISHEVLIAGGESEICISDGAGIGPRSIIINGTHDINTAIDMYPRGREFSLPIHIGERVSIYSNVMICAGVTIGKHAIVGAGSVVLKDIPDYTFAVGSPCKPIKRWNIQLKKWESIKCMGTIGH